MANKIYNVYSNDQFQPEPTDHLIIELGCHHLCLVVTNRSESVQAVEWFTFSDEEAQNADNFLREFVSISLILGHGYRTASLFINNDQCVFVPGEVYKNELNTDYIVAALGEGLGYTNTHNTLIDKGPVAVFRYKTVLADFIKDRFNIDEIRHTNTRLLQKWMHHKNMPDQLLNVVFYEDKFLLTAFSKGELKIIQTYTYQVPEDVVYYLVSVVNQVGFNIENVIVRISGLIDIPSEMHSVLMKYCKNVTIEPIQLGKVNLAGSKYPLHYFTPLFNLAI